MYCISGALHIVIPCAALKYIHVILILIVTREDHPFLEAVKDSPPSVIVGVVCFFSVWSVLGLAGFHTYLTTSNQTTNEDVSVSHILCYSDVMIGFCNTVKPF
jgi:palmitoyltransferase ZDHHC9/14/18